MLKLIRNFASDQNGATAIEYGLIAALIAVVVIGVLGNIGNKLLADLTTVANNL